MPGGVAERVGVLGESSSISPEHAGRYRPGSAPWPRPGVLRYPPAGARATRGRSRPRHAQDVARRLPCHARRRRGASSGAQLPARDPAGARGRGRGVGSTAGQATPAAVPSRRRRHSLAPPAPRDDRSHRRAPGGREAPRLRATQLHAGRRRDRAPAGPAALRSRRADGGAAHGRARRRALARAGSDARRLGRSRAGARAGDDATSGEGRPHGPVARGGAREHLRRRSALPGRACTRRDRPTRSRAASWRHWPRRWPTCSPRPAPASRACAGARTRACGGATRRPSPVRSTSPRERPTIRSTSTPARASPARRCRRPVERMPLAGRSTFFCGRCQR